MAKENGNVITQNGSKIDAIKEIIFGQTMQEYDQRFSNLEGLLQDKLNDQKKESDRRMKALEKAFSTYKAESEEKRLDLEKKISTQMESLKNATVEKKILKKYLISLVENL